MFDTSLIKKGTITEKTRAQRILKTDKRVSTVGRSPGPAAAPVRASRGSIAPPPVATSVTRLSGSGSGSMAVVLPTVSAGSFSRGRPLLSLLWSDCRPSKGVWKAASAAPHPLLSWQPPPRCPSPRRVCSQQRRTGASWKDPGSPSSLLPSPPHASHRLGTLVPRLPCRTLCW